MTRIKICGITNQSDAEMATSLGVDFLGLIFTPESPRFIDVARAKIIRKKVNGSGTKVVGVFKNQEAETVNKIAELVDLDLIQLHGDETREYIYRIEKPVIKVIEYNGSNACLNNAVSYRYCSHLLLDKPKTYKLKTNKEPDYANIKAMVSNLRPDFQRVFLAGGITADSAKILVEAIKPYGIDVCSGIEKAYGVKDHHLMKKLVRNIKSKG